MKLTQQNLFIFQHFDVDQGAHIAARTCPVLDEQGAAEIAHRTPPA